MNTALIRQKIVDEAKTWLGTPYHSCADVKGAGVDCGMILVRIFVDLGLLDPFDPRPYNSDWHLHRDAEKYLEFLTDRCVEVSEPGLGDVMVFRYGRCYSHAGIVTDTNPLSIIHAYQPLQAVVSSVIGQDKDLSSSMRVPKFFSVVGKTNE